METFFAYSDAVCLAVLEYYAFDAGDPQPEALKNFRLLAGTVLLVFIYTQVGYDPQNVVPSEWKQFHDRVSLTYNSVPHGFFGIFKEMADMIVTLGQAGLHIDSKFVPHISVGTSWSKHWARMRNSQQSSVKDESTNIITPRIFRRPPRIRRSRGATPDAALAEFRRWIREDYIGEGKFQKYIEGKVQQKQLPASFAQLAIAAYSGED